MLKGIYPALITPYKDNGEVDYEAYEKMINMLFDGGVHGVFATGSTAEFPLLTKEERMKLIDITIKACKGRGEAIIHVGDQSTEKTIELAKYAEAKGAAAVIAVTPGYYKFPVKEVVRYYHDLADSVNIPVLAYDIPNFTNRELLSDDYLFDLMRHPNFYGFKGTTTELYLEERFKRLYPERVLLHGFDETFTAALLLGADGGIGGTYNVMPKFFVKLYESIAVKKDVDEARKLQHMCNVIIDKMVPINHTLATKYLMSKYGIGNGKCRKPFKDLSSEEKATLDEIFDLIQKIEKSM